MINYNIEEIIKNEFPNGEIPYFDSKDPMDMLDDYIEAFYIIYNLHETGSFEICKETSKEEYIELRNQLINLEILAEFITRNYFNNDYGITKVRETAEIHFMLDVVILFKILDDLIVGHNWGVVELITNDNIIETDSSYISETPAFETYADMCEYFEMFPIEALIEYFNNHKLIKDEGYFIYKIK